MHGFGTHKGLKNPQNLADVICTLPPYGEGGDMCCRKQLATPLAAAASRNALPPPPVVAVPDNFHSGGGGDGDCDERCGQLSEKGTDRPFVVAGPRCAVQVFWADTPLSFFCRPITLAQIFFHRSSISLVRCNGECDKRDWHRCHEEAEDC